MKRKILIILTTILSICMLAMVAIGCNNNEQPDQQNNALQFRFLNAPSSMVMGEVKKLSYIVDGTDDMTATFTSSDDNVAKIDNDANLEAINLGQVIITGKSGESEMQFTLTVVKNDGLPQFVFSNYVGNDGQVNVVINQKLNLSGYVFYNGNNYSDGQISYEIDDKSVATIDNNGVLTAKGKGSATVTVTAKWRNMESALLVKEITVNVTDDAQILLNDGEVNAIQIYTIGEHGGKSYDRIFNVKENAKFYVNGEDVTESATFEVVDNKAERSASPAVKFEKGNLTSVNYGSARLVASIEKDGRIISHSVGITVERPVMQYPEELLFSQADGTFVKTNGLDFDYTEVFGSISTIVEAYQGGVAKVGEKLTVRNDTISDYALTSANALQDDTITVYTAKSGVTMKVKSCYKVLNDAEDVKSVYGTSSTSNISGYFYVATDIDATGVTIKPTGYTGSTTGSKFSGIFDGNGCSITFNTTKGGLFGQLAGTVKNTSFIVKGVGSHDVGSNVIIAGWADPNSKVENVYATYDIDNFKPDLSKIGSGWRNAGLGLFEASNYGSLTNVILDMSKVELDGAHGTSKVINYGLLFCPSNGGWAYGTAKNCHVIWNVKELHYYYPNSLSKVAMASNDDNTGYEDGRFKNIVGATRFDNYNQAAEYFSNNFGAAEPFYNVANMRYGFPYELVGQTEHLVKNGVEVKVDGEVVDTIALDVKKDATKTITVEFLNNHQDFTVTHESGSKIVNVNGNEISFVANSTAGTEKLKVSSTIEGYSYEQIITVTVSVDNIGEILYDGEGDVKAVYGDKLNGKTITKLIDLENSDNIFYDSAVATNDGWSLARNTQNKTVTKKAYAYNGNELLGEVDITCVYKLITKGSDLTSVYGTSSTSDISGYFLVLNDIDATGVTIKPTGYSGGESGSKFSGIFDGNGKTITYGVTKGGLFGRLTGTVKNVSLIVNSVGSKDYGSNVMLAGWAAPSSVVENVYAKYDFEFTPDLSYVASGVYRNAGLGLFEATNYNKLTNVILDLSNVTLDGAHGTNKVKNYGVLFCTSNSAWGYGTATNCHVIWNVKELHFYNATTSINKVAVATGDTAKTTYNGMSVSASKVLTGVTRYDNVSAMNGTTVGNFTVTNGTVTWND